MKRLNFSTESNFKNFIDQYLVLNSHLYSHTYIKNGHHFYIFSPHKISDLPSNFLKNINLMHYIEAEIYVQASNIGYFCIIEDNLDNKHDEDELFKYLTSQSSKMAQVFNILKKVAKTSFPVLVRGESGAGKERIAQLVHQFGKRSTHPFISINCASLHSNILESELFGYVKGAFTGAIRDHKGVFERANHGTLFLDEIAELPLSLQAKLLRVLETGEFTPLGGEKTIVTDVRIVTATHRALREEAKHGRFRYDLLYRLRVIPIFIPPLRERKIDIPYLVDKIINEYSRDYPTQPKIDREVFKIFDTYDWPGNIRELKNTLLYALTMAYDRPSITVEDLPQELIFESLQQSSLHVNKHVKITKEQLTQVLQESEYDLSQTLDKLNISRSTLWRYRKKWNI